MMELLMLTGATPDIGIDTEKVWTETVRPLVSTVVYILMGILVAILLIKGITTAIAITKAADDAQLRQEKLSGFKYLAIGLGIGLVVLVLLRIALDWIGNLFLKQGS